MSMQDRLAAIEARFEELTAEMGRPEVAADYERLQALARERAAIEEIVSLHREARDVQRALDDARSVLAEGGDPELVALAKDEVETLTTGLSGKIWQKISLVGELEEGKPPA